MINWGPKEIKLIKVALVSRLLRASYMRISIAAREASIPFFTIPTSRPMEVYIRRSDLQPLIYKFDELYNEGKVSIEEFNKRNRFIFKMGWF